MEKLKKSLNKFFITYNKKININKLISIFKVSYDDYDILNQALYELEQEGKILGDDDNNYIYKAEDFYLKEGIIQKSTKNKFYVNLGSGIIINIPKKNLNGAKEEDLVFVSVKKGEKHSKQKIGDVVRVVKPPRIENVQNFYKAIIRKNYTENYCYIKVNDNRIYIPDKSIKGAYPGDLVSVQTSDGKLGSVVEILERKNNQHVFEYKEIKGVKRFSPIGTADFEIDLKIKSDIEFNIGDRILVDLFSDNKAKFIRKINNSNDLKSYIKALYYDSGFYIDFSEKSKEEIKKISSEISLEEKSKRVDLRNLITFTIDGKHAKDLDDAVSLEFKDDKYYLYVHIADVSNYVKYDSFLFKDAYSKGTSVYPANSVFPMLPKELSNGVCSLNPNEDKLTKTCKIEFDLNGNILDFKVFNSIINSNFKMSYGKVNDILTNKNIDNDYIPYVETLNKMNELSNLLQTKKIDRGFLCFEDCSRKFNFNEDGDVESVFDTYRGPAELLIENFMLVTNELITSLAFYYQLPFIYRNHEGPNIDQISKLRSNLSGFKNFINTIKNISNQKVLQRVLLTICKNKESLEAMYFSKLILRCMNRANYDVNNNGHYALALDYYGTFTSPIRRFPDLLNHYMIEKIITGDLDDLEMFSEEYKKMVLHCNETEIDAEKFEKNIEKMLLKEYVSKYIGMTLDAKIEFIAHNLICIRTTNNLYGYVELPKSCFKGNKVTINNVVYQTGDKVVVTLDKIKPNSDEILFTMVEKRKKLVKRKKEKV